MSVVLAHLIFHYDLIFDFSDSSFVAERFGSAVFLVSRLPVYFFFLISGYVIGLTVLSVPSMLQFAIYRFARLFPAYWAAVLATTAVLHFAPDVGRIPDGAEIAANITMAPALLGMRMIDPVYWSLAYELVFYSVVALFFSAFPATGRNLCVLAATLLVASVIHAAATRPGAESALGAHLFEFAPFFAGGIAFFLWRRGERDLLTVSVLLASAIVAATRIEGAWHPSAFLLFALFFVVVSGLAHGLRSAPLIYLGRISYPLYLFHLAPGFLAISALDRLGAPIWLSVGVAVALIILLAHLLHTFIEVPARRKIRALSAKLSPSVIKA